MCYQALGRCWMGLNLTGCLIRCWEVFGNPHLAAFERSDSLRLLKLPTEYKSVSMLLYSYLVVSLKGGCDVTCDRDCGDVRIKKYPFGVLENQS